MNCTAVQPRLKEVYRDALISHTKKMHLIKTRHAEREKSAYFLTSPRVELLVLLCYKICQTQPPQLRQRKAVWVGGFQQCWTI